MKDIDIEIQVATKAEGLDADGYLFVVPVEKDSEKDTEKDSEKDSEKDAEKDESITPVSFSKMFPAWVKEDVLKFASQRKFEAKPNTLLCFDDKEGRRVSIGLFAKHEGVFEWLTHARKVVQSACIEPKVRHLAVDLTSCKALTSRGVDAIVSAIGAALYEFPKYKTTTTKTAATQKAALTKTNRSKPADDTSLVITLIVERTHLSTASKVANAALSTTTAGTNLVRWLAKRAGNDLTCKQYMTYVKSLSATRKWRFELIGHDQLVKQKAGAFLAVVQGSEHRDYGIAKIVYSPKGAKKHLVLVGKGLVFDTGGHSLKQSAHMLGMHGDMTGSAVALSLINLATLEKWPIKITSFLAIADNMIGPRSYKPNDVITAANGTTIEIIDTDAEGRMVLADTLHLASKEKPDLMMDFATLTGACVRAIGTTFSGAFSNRPDFLSDLIDSGYASGERVWPFPMDKDFANCLDSTSADTKQCREKGGVDHIEASQFLSKFVDEKVAWVHIDLSACENAGGLAHIPTDETGFGTRFAKAFISRKFKLG
jgi:leucyl aminopeptidase